MRGMILAFGLIAAVASGADAGEGPKPVLLLVEDPAVVQKYAVAQPSARAAIKGVLTGSPSASARQPRFFSRAISCHFPGGWI